MYRRTTYLERHHYTIYKLSEPCIVASPDLGLILIDDACYYLQDNLDSVHPWVMPWLDLRHSSVLHCEDDQARSNRSFLHSRFSTCNRYLANVDPGSIQPSRSPKLELYQIQYERDRIARIELLENFRILAFSWLDAVFHPTLPIVSIVTTRIEAVEGYQRRREVFECYVVRLTGTRSDWVRLEEVYTREVKCKSCRKLLSRRLIIIPI